MVPRTARGLKVQVETLDTKHNWQSHAHGSLLPLSGRRVVGRLQTQGVIRYAHLPWARLLLPLQGGYVTPDMFTDCFSHPTNQYGTITPGENHKTQNVPWARLLLPLRGVTFHL